MSQGRSRFDLSRLNFFSRLDARARVFVLLGVVIGVIVAIYFATRWFASGTGTTGPSRVASAPQGLQSVPGGQQTPEFSKAVEQANVQRAQQAQMSGSSAIPTLYNPGNQPGATCIVCTEQSANVRDLLEDWARQGKLDPDIATALEQLADKNVSPEDYAAQLQELVRQGKLTPEQARQLLEQYRKQHANALLDESAKGMDQLIKSGQMPLDVANQLLNAQKNNASPSDYAAQLQELVRQGKISPALAQQLLAQYSQQRAKEIVARSIASLKQMVRNGEITADVEKNLEDLENRMVPVDLYAAELQKYTSSGKMTPVASKKILDEFKSQKAQIGPTETVDQLLKAAEAAAYQELIDLQKEGKITPDTAVQIKGMIDKNVSMEEFQANIARLVQEKKLTPEIAKLKLADYVKVKQLREMSQRLAALQGNNAGPAAYADELRKAVESGAITPEQAAQLLQEYQAMTSRATVAPGTGAAEGSDFARLQERMQQGAAAQPTVPPTEFSQVQVQAAQETAQEREARLQSIMSAMSGQAQSLIASWQPPKMEEKVGIPDTSAADKALAAKAGAGTAPPGSLTPPGSELAGGAPIIKAGTILFAVLDTAVNSDYPDSPVMATIVDGPFKGAKLLGKLTTTKGVSGQMDRISLNFTLMNMDQWPKGKTTTAYAIDPDTARTVLASSVDYHYMQRFGAIMATSFLQGYATAILNEGTSTTGIFGTSTTNPALSPGNKIAVGLGQMGQALGAVTQNYVNIPPTVRVDSGVGLGILFMADVT